MKVRTQAVLVAGRLHERPSPLGIRRSEIVKLKIEEEIK